CGAPQGDDRAPEREGGRDDGTDRDPQLAVAGGQRPGGGVGKTKTLARRRSGREETGRDPSPWCANEVRQARDTMPGRHEEPAGGDAAPHERGGARGGARLILRPTNVPECGAPAARILIVSDDRFWCARLGTAVADLGARVAAVSSVRRARE